MLSKDIATEFRGRATQIHVFPLTFEEFYSYVGGEKRTALEQYMLYGGMPQIASMIDERDKKTYLTNPQFPVKSTATDRL
jgi:predicted AAA+ superfamily ATPase